MSNMGLGNLQHETTNNLHIRSYNKNHFFLSDESEYHQSIAILNDQLYTEITPLNFEELTEIHYHKWLELRPTLILVGTGNTMKFLDPKWRAFFYQQRIGIETMPTESLCRTFTILAVEERNALGIFFPLTQDRIDINNY